MKTNQTQYHYWHSGLSVAEKNHLTEDAGLSLKSKADFIETLKWQHEKTESCQECDAIAKKLGIKL